MDEEGSEGFAQRLRQQWSDLRIERERRLAFPTARPDDAVPGRFTRSQVPIGLDLAAAWAWRILLIVALAYVLGRVVGFLSVLVVPLVVATLISALVAPLVGRLSRYLPRGVVALLTVVMGLAAVVSLLGFVGRQVAGGANDLASSSVAGLDQIRTWLRDGPLQISDSQLDEYLTRAQKAITESSQGGDTLHQLTHLGTTVGHVFAGIFIVLFATYFFLADGQRIWAWIVRLTPRAARARVDSSGRVAWISLTQFVRATVIVALVDAVGISIVALILGVPFVLAIGVLVFLGAFVPMVGATVAGTVAILVALVDQGPLTALLMLGGVVLVQQIEGHVLQPFLMGRWVSVHPLGVIVAIGAGVLVAGIAGALVAVPLAAAVNAVGLHLAAGTDPGDDPLEMLDAVRADDADAASELADDADDPGTDPAEEEEQ
ncbi:AI-2E family transporter [Nocardioides acrostichi]|uniref:AI-2E family transporter n=1 Tax=Nocardioides acrostichi TaxID=2784339 RepID=A0A930V0P8_9ACTN|nr:AI-2E family transporter [Nocardioides acrostichi]MBF4163556.1 AI-2E family transporter [Nocardioides acrostichi]